MPSFENRTNKIIGCTVVREGLARGISVGEERENIKRFMSARGNLVNPGTKKPIVLPGEFGERSNLALNLNWVRFFEET